MLAAPRQTVAAKEEDGGRERAKMAKSGHFGADMAKKRVIKSARGVTLTEAIIFGGEPRKKIGVAYTVTSKRLPEGRSFDNLATAKKAFSVQVSLGGRE